jgi:hypothetical protein
MPTKSLSTPCSSITESVRAAEMGAPEYKRKVFERYALRHIHARN